MKKYTGLLFGMLLLIAARAQNPLELTSLPDSGLCERLFEENGLRPADSLSAQLCIYVGVCLMHRAEYSSALGYLDQAVRQNHELAIGYFYKAEVFLQMNRLKDALIQYDNAIYLRPEVPDFLLGKGYALFQSGRYEEAVSCFQQALSMDSCPERAYVLLGRAYQESGQIDLALGAYYHALEKLPPKGDSYRECLHRLGLLQYLLGNFPEAESAFRQILSFAPDDYQAISRSIQVFYAAGQYQKGNALKMNLYSAFNRGQLPRDMVEKGFCFDQFVWEGKRIYVYERFEEPDGYFPKHLFFVTDEKDHVLEIIQTEHTREASLSGKKYILGHIKGDAHILYEDVAFDDNFDYLVLKKAVIRILKGKEKRK